LKRPRRHGTFRGKSKVLDRAPDPALLEDAAVNVRYAASPYHCPENGRSPPRRAKPASHCEGQWTTGRALVRLREAIRAGQISRQWIEGFPRHVWHKEADIWYEACTSNGTPGVYHAYRIEIVGLPPGLLP
jgi:hypothetical protein